MLWIENFHRDGRVMDDNGDEVGKVTAVHVNSGFNDPTMMTVEIMVLDNNALNALLRKEME